MGTDLKHSWSEFSSSTTSVWGQGEVRGRSRLGHGEIKLLHICLKWIRHTTIAGYPSIVWSRAAIAVQLQYIEHWYLEYIRHKSKETRGPGHCLYRNSEYLNSIWISSSLNCSGSRNRLESLSVILVSLACSLLPSLSLFLSLLYHYINTSLCYGPHLFFFLWSLPYSHFNFFFLFIFSFSFLSLPLFPPPLSLSLQAHCLNYDYIITPLVRSEIPREFFEIPSKFYIIYLLSSFWVL